MSHQTKKTSALAADLLDSLHPAKLHLADYCECASGGAWERAPHLDLICRALEAVERYVRGESEATELPPDEVCAALLRGEPIGIARLMILLPPRHGKSEVVSRHFAPWFLGRNPELEVILTSYNDEMARFMSRAAREIFREATTALWGLLLKGDTAAVDHWELRGHKGKFQAAGVGGSLTGRGGNVFLIDDPEKGIEEAESPARQRMKWDWYRGVVRTRLAPRGAIVGIGTWWAKSDLFGRILEEQERGGEHWVVIRLPAIAVDRDPLADRLPMAAFKKDLIGRIPGDALWPDRFPLHELEQTRRTLGRLWNGLYQQNPTGDIEGALWNADTMIDPFRVLRANLPELDRIVIAVDPSGSGKASADEVGIGVAGRAWVWHEKERTRLRNGYVLEDLSGRYSPREWAVRAIEAFHHWKANAIIAETNYGGELVSTNIHAIDPDIPVILVNATRGKARRAEPVVNAYEQGRVHHAGRFPELEEEMTSWVRWPEPRWSPNRMDWMVWAMTDLLINATAGRGFVSAYAGRFGLLPGGRRREGGVQQEGKAGDEK